MARDIPDEDAVDLIVSYTEEIGKISPDIIKSFSQKEIIDDIRNLLLKVTTPGATLDGFDCIRNMDTGNAIQSLFVFFQGNIHKVLAPLEDMPILLKHDNFFVTEVAKYRLQKGV